MAQFERMDFPETDIAAFFISDNSGHKVELTPQQAVDLLQWLFEQRNNLFRLVYPELEERAKTLWLQDLPEGTLIQQEPEQKWDPSLGVV